MSEVKSAPVKAQRWRGQPSANATLYCTANKSLDLDLKETQPILGYK